MIKKILLGLLLLAFLAVAGAYVLLKTKSDVLLQKFSAFVEENTGAPLVMEKIPSLTFFPSPGLDMGKATWGRDTGNLFVSFSRASVRVSASALLTGRIDISSMEVDDLDVTVRLKADASAASTPASSGNSGDNRGNVSATGSTASPADSQSLAQAAKPAPGAAAVPPAKLARPAQPQDFVNRILAAIPTNLKAQRARVTLIEADGTATTFSGVDLVLKNARPGGELALTMQAQAERKPVTGQAMLGMAELDAKAVLDGSELALDIKKALFTPKSGLSFTSPVSLSGGGLYALTTGTLSLSNVHLGLPGLKVTLQGKADSVPALLRDALHEGAAILDVKLDGSPRELLTAFGKPLSTADPKALDKAVLSASAALNKGHLQITRLEGSLDATTVAGNLDIRLAPLAIKGDLNVGDVNLDAWLPPVASSSEKAAPEASATTAASAETSRSEPRTAATNVVMAQPIWPDLSLTAKISKLKARGIELADIQVRAEGKGGHYTANPLTFRMFGSPVTAGLTAALSRPATGVRASVSANISAPRVNLAEASMALLKKDAMAGTGALNTTLSCDTAAPLATLSGKGSLSAEPLELKVDVLPANAPVPPNTKRPGTFDKALLTFTANRGIITITDCSLTAPRLGVTGAGTVDLPRQTLDISGSVQIPGLAVLPVRLTGPLSKPSYSLSAKNTINAVEQTLKQHGVDLGGEIQRGLGRFFRK